MHSRCAFVCHSLYSYSSPAFWIPSSLCPRANLYPLPPSSRSTGSAKVRSSSPDPGVSISATICDGPNPGINDTPGENGWETILADRPWGAQEHYAYTGFAWYRLNLRITPAPDVKTDFQLLLPSLQDVCEVYWNGRLVGRYGKLPPHPSSPALNAPAAFTLPDFRSGTLAIRVWDRTARLQCSR